MAKVFKTQWSQLQSDRGSLFSVYLMFMANLVLFQAQPVNFDAWLDEIPDQYTIPDCQRAAS